MRMMRDSIGIWSLQWIRRLFRAVLELLYTKSLTANRKKFKIQSG